MPAMVLHSHLGINSTPAADPASGEPSGRRRCSVVRCGRHIGEGRLEEERELVERAKRGDVDAYEGLVRRYQQVAFRTAYLLLGTDAEAEDAAQEAFVKAYYALGRFRPDAPFCPWLLRIVANEARNRRKAIGRRAALALRLRDDLQGAAPSPESTVVAREQQVALLDAVNELRDEDRQVVAYRYFLDLSEAEMAEALGCPRGTVKSRLSRALGRLRQRLAGAVEGDARRELADG